MKDIQKKLLIHIPNELFVEGATKKFEGNYDIEMIKGCYDTFFLLCPILYDVDITNMGDTFLVKGKFDTKLKTNCSRCLELYSFKLYSTIESYFLINPKHKLTEDLEYENLPSNHNIDLGKILIYSLLLDVPKKPLCSTNCKGICSSCGINLNIKKCQCNKNEVVDNAFSVLKNFKIKN